MLTDQSDFDTVARAIVLETGRRGYAKHESIACLSTLIQESSLRMVWSKNGLWYGYAQQDAGYVNRMDPNGNLLGFLDRLDVKRASPGASPDIWLNIFWLQQRPSEPSADVAYANGRQAYLTEIKRHIDQATQLYDKYTGGTTVGWTGDPVWLADVLRAEGLRCDISDGAFDRGHGDMSDIWGVLCHHTGSNNASWQSIAFHPELGLCSQLHLSRTGVYTLCGVGVAWHAGSGSYPGVGSNNGNQRLIGIEAANDGGGSPGKPHRSSWPDVQYDAYVRGVAAILRKLGYNESHAIAHKEWAGATQGKWDPGAIDMNIFRHDVGARLRGGPVAPVGNAIDEAYKAAPWLGKRLTPELSTPDGHGRYAAFEHGHIYWTDKTGARPIPKLLFEVWARLGYEKGLGYPTRFFTVIPDVGDIQAFERGVLYRKYGAPDGFYVHGKIGEQYAAQGFESGPLGWPTSNEIKFNGGVYQDFESGRLLFSPTGVVAVKHPVNFL